jgi:plastocyanin
MRKFMLASSLLIALSLILALAGCKTTPAATPTPTSIITSPTPTPATTPTPAQANVEISGFAFVPSTLTVSVGTTVTWTNKDSVTHTVTSNDNLFNSGDLANGATFQHAFNQKGTFDYHCSIHTFMTGKIIVE